MQHVDVTNATSKNDVILRQMGVMQHMPNMSRRRKRQRHATLPTKNFRVWPITYVPIWGFACFRQTCLESSRFSPPVFSKGHALLWAIFGRVGKRCCRKEVSCELGDRPVVHASSCIAGIQISTVLYCTIQIINLCP